MFCNRCGNRLPEDAVFCDMCGNKVSFAGAEPQQPEAGEAASPRPGGVPAPPQSDMAVPTTPLYPYDQAPSQIPQQAPLQTPSQMPQPPYYPVSPEPAASSLPAQGYAQPSGGAKKGKKRGLLPVVIIGAVALIAAAAVFIVFMMNRRDNTDYIATVSKHQPFVREGFSTDFGTVFDEYIRGADYEVRKESDAVYVDVTGTLKGTGEKIEITIEASADARVTPRSVRIDGVRTGTRNEAVEFLLLMFDAYDRGLNTIDIGDSASPFISGGGAAPEPIPPTPPGQSPGPAQPPSPATTPPPPTATPAPATPSATPSPEPMPPPETPLPPSETPNLTETEMLYNVALDIYWFFRLEIYWDNNTTTIFEREPFTTEWIMYSRDGSVRPVEPTFAYYGNVCLISFPTTEKIYVIFDDGTGYFGDETFTWYFEYFE